MVHFSGSDIFLFVIGFFLPPLVSFTCSPVDATNALVLGAYGPCCCSSLYPQVCSSTTLMILIPLSFYLGSRLSYSSKDAAVSSSSASD
ncbi:unnamed protein product [Mortierella alpina]